MAILSQRKEWVIKPGYLETKRLGKNQPGYDFTRMVMDALVNKGLVTTDDCCMYQLDGQYNTFTPLTGTTITLPNVNVNKSVINPAGTLAALTIKLPLMPTNGQRIKIIFTKAITTLTINGNGSTLVGTAATSAAIGTQLEYEFLTGIGFLRILS
jgi:hypothetical protein